MTPMVDDPGMPTGDTRGAVQADQLRWTARPAVSFVVRALSVVLPFIASWLVVRTLAPLFWHPAGWIGLCIWVLQAAIVATTVSAVVERFTRRLLPLSMLFSLSLAFPDNAPSRFGIALRSGSATRRKSRIRTIRREGLSDDLAEASAQALELLTLLNMHDRRTRGHSERVRAYSVVIGEEMGLSDTDLNLLSWAALLHDIGKIDVPADILNSPDSPTPVEWGILQGHPSAGEEFLAPLAPWLGSWVGAANDHHERWDGSGYPHGLAGTDISLAGRIVAVADAYDVITSKRSYKQVMSADAARRELIRSSGSHFDPAVVRTFLNVSLDRRPTLGPLGWLLELPLRTSLAGTPMTPLVAGAVVVSTSFGAAPAGPQTLAMIDQPTEPAALTSTAGTPVTTEAEFVAAELAPSSSSVTVAPTTSTSELAGPTTESPETTTTTTAASTPTTTAPGTSTTTAGPTTTTIAPTTTVTNPPTTGPTTTATAPTTTTPQSEWAHADAEWAVTGNTVQIWVLDNDTPAAAFNFDSLRIVAGPANGSVSIYSPPGSPMAVRIRYRSDDGFIGDDEFIYEICDVDGACAQATVTVTVG